MSVFTFGNYFGMKYEFARQPVSTFRLTRRQLSEDIKKQNKWKERKEKK
jgi:hypothetical protein